MITNAITHWLATSMIGRNWPCRTFTPNGYSLDSIHGTHHAQIGVVSSLVKMSPGKMSILRGVHIPRRASARGPRCALSRFGLVLTAARRLGGIECLLVRDGSRIASA